MAKVLDYEERLKDGKFVVSVEITNFIKEWLTKHIMGTDKKYTSFPVEKGVKQTGILPGKLHPTPFLKTIQNGDFLINRVY